jgi:hypothetical protein
MRHRKLTAVLCAILALASLAGCAASTGSQPTTGPTLDPAQAFAEASAALASANASLAATQAKLDAIRARIDSLPPGDPLRASTEAALADAEAEVARWRLYVSVAQLAVEILSAPSAPPQVTISRLRGYRRTAPPR